MKQLTLTIAVLLLAQLSWGWKGVEIKEPKSPVFRSVTNNSFQVGEELRYRLHYGFIDAGEAKLYVKATDKKVKGRKLIHVEGIGRSLGAFDWFFKVRDRYESYIDKTSVFPWIFIRRVNEGGYIINQDYTFYQHKKTVDLGEKGKKELKVPANIQDMLSSYYYARTMDFSKAKVGDTYTLSTIVDGEVYPLKIRYKGKETVNLRKGKYRCLRFAPVVQKGRIFKTEDDLSVWITDDKNKIPVLAKANVLVGSIKMELVGYKNLLNPIAEVKKKK